ncbi:MAG: hypothetical protein ACI86C_001306 [Candidatus Latescibacterota bacterium]|jgi:hypothetical protein
MKIVIQIVLWILIIFLGYKLWNSIAGPIEFNKIKEARYAKVIKNLKDIKAAQLAHQEIAGGFAGDFSSLIQFIDTAQFAITARRDTSYADQVKNKAYGLDAMTGGYDIEATIIDTLGFAPVKDSLYGGTDRYMTMMNVPIEEVEVAKFELEAGKIEKNGAEYAVFEVKVAKAVILADQNSDMVNQESQIISVNGVNGAYIKVGSMDEVDTSGNWPKLYDSVKQK